MNIYRISSSFGIFYDIFNDFIALDISYVFAFNNI